jgi:hypothetical protein
LPSLLLLVFFTIVTGFTSEEKEVGRYQIAVTNSGGRKVQLYRVDTKTGVIVDINESELEKIRARKGNMDKQ